MKNVVLIGTVASVVALCVAIALGGCGYLMGLAAGRSEDSPGRYAISAYGYGYGWAYGYSSADGGVTSSDSSSDAAAGAFVIDTKTGQVWHYHRAGRVHYSALGSADFKAEFQRLGESTWTPLPTKPVK